MSGGLKRYNCPVGFAGNLVLFVVYALGICFAVLQFKSLREASRGRPRPSLRDVMRGLAILCAVYGPLVAVFFVGWRLDGLSGGVITAVGAVLLGVLTLLVMAIKSAWVRKTPSDPANTVRS